MKIQLNNSELTFHYENPLSRAIKKQQENCQVARLAAECANYDQAEALVSYQKMRTKQPLKRKSRNRDVALFHYDVKVMS